MELNIMLEKEQLDLALATMPPREQEVIKMRFGLDGGYSYTFEEVGLYFNLTGEQIRRIEAKALWLIRNYILSVKGENNGTKQQPCTRNCERTGSDTRGRLRHWGIRRIR